MKNDTHYFEGCGDVNNNRGETDPELLAKIFLRRTAVKRDKGGFVIVNEKDVIDWFKNGDHLRKFHETDLM